MAENTNLLFLDKSTPEPGVIQTDGGAVIDTNTTKPPIKRPVFVNFDDDENMNNEENLEITTEVELDTRLDPNAIKSLIG